jgi:hypothetical protein
VVLKSADPLQLLNLIEKTVQMISMVHYVVAVAYKQHKIFYHFQQ